MRGGLLLLAAAIAGAAIGGGEATAGGPAAQRTAVFVVGAEQRLDAGRHTRLLDVLGAALAREPRVALVDVDQQLAARAGEIPAERLSEARGLLRAGEVLLRKGRASDALVRLQTAADHLGRSLAFVSKRELSRAQFLVGAAHALLGRADAATAAFVELQVWRPDFVADTTLAPARVLPPWQAAQRQVARRPGGSIEVGSTPAGALVYVDGARVGVSPTTVEGLVVGRHYVTLRQAGHRRTVIAVDVSASSQRAIDAPLSPTTGYQRLRAQIARVGRPGAARAGPALAEVGAELALDHALVVWPPERPGQPYRLALYHARTRARLAAASVAADRDAEEALRQAVRSLYAELVVAAAPAPPPPPRRAPTARRPARRLWLWAGLTATAAVALPLLWLAGRGAEPGCPAGSRCGELVLDF